MADAEDRDAPVVLTGPNGSTYTALNADQADFWVATGHWRVASKTAVRELEKNDALPAPGTGTAKEK